MWQGAGIQQTGHVFALVSPSQAAKGSLKKAKSRLDPQEVALWGDLPLLRLRVGESRHSLVHFPLFGEVHLARQSGALPV